MKSGTNKSSLHGKDGNAIDFRALAGACIEEDVSEDRAEADPGADQNIVRVAGGVRLQSAADIV